MESLDSDFKVHHFAVIDVIDGTDETTLGKEQDILDEHDDEISALIVRLQKLITTCSPIADPDARKIPSRKFARLDKNLSINDQIRGGCACIMIRMAQKIAFLHIISESNQASFRPFFR